MINQTITTIKRFYRSPEISFEAVSLEYPIAAGSATVVTVDGNQEVLHKWETGTDQSGELLW